MQGIDALLQEGLRLSQAGEKRQAARLLVTALRQDPSNERAWWLLSGCVETPEQKRDCLLRVLRINPNHSAARTMLLREFGTQPFREHFPAGFDQTAPLHPAESGAPDLAAAPPPEPYAQPPGQDAQHTIHPPAAQPIGVEGWLAQGRAAEWVNDFEAAYHHYQAALRADPASAEGWLGLGYAAARRSGPEFNGFPEFFACLQNLVLARDRDGLPFTGALARIHPELARAVHGRLAALLPLAEELSALTSGGPLANLFAVERARLADAAFTVGRLAPGRPGSTLHELEKAALSAFDQIIANARLTTRSARARRELLRNYQSLLLNSLTTSGLGQHPEFAQRLEQRILQSP